MKRFPLRFFVCRSIKIEIASHFSYGDRIIDWRKTGTLGMLFLFFLSIYLPLKSCAYIE